MTDPLKEDRLTQYLLGSLPEEEAERLDELSITNDEFAAQLNAAENDIVDAYVRGELPEKTAARFDAVYLSSPKRRQKLMMAETLLAHYRVDRSAPRAARSASRPEHKKFFQFLHVHWSLPQWGMAALATILLVVTGYLGMRNQQLRRRLAQLEVTRSSLENQQKKRPVSATASLPSGDHLRVATFVFLPALRSSGPIPRVTVSSDTDLIVLKLELESSEFPRYRVTLVDAATRQPLWSSAELSPMSERNGHAVSFALKPASLQQKNYILELNGVRSNGRMELVSTYPFASIVK